MQVRFELESLTESHEASTPRGSLETPISRLTLCTAPFRRMAFPGNIIHPLHPVRYFFFGNISAVHMAHEWVIRD